MDPVALVVRTGLPFDYVLNLSAQSQAWCWLGLTVGNLAPLGLRDARALAKLSEWVERTPPDDEAQAILESASKAASLDKVVLRSAIRNIAAEPYTQFRLCLRASRVLKNVFEGSRCGGMSSDASRASDDIGRCFPTAPDSNGFLRHRGNLRSPRLSRRNARRL